jgi:hypothetical protein
MASSLIPATIDDAVLTAATQLCTEGRDLATTEWRSAVSTYDAPDAYAYGVTVAANSYARASVVGSARGASAATSRA